MHTAITKKRHVPNAGEASEEKRNNRRFRQNMAVFFSRSLTKHAARSFERKWLGDRGEEKTVRAYQSIKAFFLRQTMRIDLRHLF